MAEPTAREMIDDFARDLEKLVFKSRDVEDAVERDQFMNDDQLAMAESASFSLDQAITKLRNITAA